jgi:hypothetical protein
MLVNSGQLGPKYISPERVRTAGISITLSCGNPHRFRCMCLQL